MPQRNRLGSRYFVFVAFQLFPLASAGFRYSSGWLALGAIIITAEEFMPRLLLEGLAGP